MEKKYKFLIRNPITKEWFETDKYYLNEKDLLQVFVELVDNKNIYQMNYKWIEE
jgi:hypothetical protein